jgi:hypothetical protein
VNSMNRKDYSITSDGRCVWVNTGKGCIGRFGVNGIDIHHEPMSQASRESECLFCTHEPVTKADWELFVQKMRELYGVSVRAKHMPARFRASSV